MRDFYVGPNHKGEIPLTTKIAAGLTTGALAITVANPTDLVKVRMSLDGRRLRDNQVGPGGGCTGSRPQLVQGAGLV